MAEREKLTVDKPKETEKEGAPSFTSNEGHGSVLKELSREQLEELRRKLRKKFH